MSGHDWYFHDDKADALTPDCSNKSQLGGKRKQQPECVYACVCVCVFSSLCAKQPNVGVCAHIPLPDYDRQTPQDIGFCLNNEITI